MKFNFKKVASVFASGVMLASTIGFAAAATFPAPFDSGSAIVYGASGNVQVDMAAAVNIQTAIGQIEGTPAGVPAGSWQVATSSDDLELNESFSEVISSIDKDELPILEGGTISTEKGTAVYNQFFYFETPTPSNPASGTVAYQQDDDENVGLFYKIVGSEGIVEYRMEFTTYLESDVTSSSDLEDIEDKEITLLGKTYAITSAKNTSTSVTDLTLMSGANKITISNGEELTVGGKTVSVLVTATNEARFTVDGETTSKLADGGTAKLADGSYLGVSDITYQNFAGGLMQATAYLGADKIELRDGNSMTVNGDAISYTNVNITETHSAGDISISRISINMTAEADLYVKEGGKLSAAADLAEPEVLITQNWDIVYSGLEDTTYNELSVKKSTDSRMDLEFVDYDGNTVKFPLVFVNATSAYPGYKNGYRLVLDPNNPIGLKRYQYFILNTAEPTTVANGDNARSFVVQFLGTDDLDGSNEKAKFKVLGGTTHDVTLSAAGAATLTLGGKDFAFANASNCHVANCKLKLTTTQYNDTDGETSGGSKSNYIRTKNNVLINITDLQTNFTQNSTITAAESAIRVNATLDDTQKDGDKYTLTNMPRVLFYAQYKNSTDDEIASTYSGGEYSNWIADPEDSTHSTFIDNYGVEIDYSNPSGSPANIVLNIPESAVTPIIHITSGAVTAGTTASGGLSPVVADSAIDSVKDKNLVVVGGSCINSVAAKLLGSEVPLCGAAFTAKTNVGAGSYIIDTFASPYAAADSGKIAMLVAGYEAAETTSAAQRVVDDSLSLDASAAAIIGPATV